MQVDYREAEGKVCILYGHGAFTIENVSWSQWSQVLVKDMYVYICIQIYSIYIYMYIIYIYNYIYIYICVLNLKMNSANIVSPNWMDIFAEVS